MAKQKRTPVLVQTDADGNIIAIARGTGIVLNETGRPGQWLDVRHDPNIHLAQAASSKHFKVRVRKGRAQLEVKDTHEVVNGRLHKKRPKKEER